jgi:uncharacterized membrane protein
MRNRSSSPRWRDRLPGRKPEPFFRWRGKEVSRLENLADAVFGFSVTLLVVAQQVPTSFDGLMEVVRSFPAFVASFAILMIFWNVHYKFFRRYGLEDLFIRGINYLILLLVLFSVYPLKFLFHAAFGLGGGIGGPGNVFVVYQLYGFGLATIWFLFGLLFWRAYTARAQLGLSPAEVLLTKMDLGMIAWNIATCAASVTLSFFPVPPWLPGVIYSTLGLTIGLNGWYYGRQVRAASGPREPVTPSSRA